MDTRKYSLTEGSISQKLLLVSVPIIGNQLIPMLYNLTDMFWLGRVGSGAVAAAGTVGMYMWLSMAFSCFGSRGAEIGVSQSIGRQDENAAQHYAQASLAISLALGIFFGGVLLLFCRPLVAFFAIEDPSVVAGAEAYLRIISIGIPFSFINMAAAGIFVGGGNARTPFYISALSLITNMILDPILIFGLGMGITGAAAATITAQILGCILILIVLCRHPARPFAQLRLFVKPVAKYVRQIFRWTVPIALESFLFTILTMLITRFVSGWGTEALAAQKLGSQVESLSWLIAGGFSSAVAAFVGQNYGAKKWSRIRKGFSISFGMMLGWGVVATLILLLFSQPIFTAFFPMSPLWWPSAPLTCTFWLCARSSLALKASLQEPSGVLAKHSPLPLSASSATPPVWWPPIFCSKPPWGSTAFGGRSASARASAGYGSLYGIVFKQRNTQKPMGFPAPPDKLFCIGEVTMKKRVLALALVLVLSMLCSCAPSSTSAQTTITRDDAQQRQQDIADVLLLLQDASPARDITENFLR